MIKIKDVTLASKNRGKGHAPWSLGAHAHAGVVKALWNALRRRHKYGATSENQYAARRCSMITRLTRNSLTRVRVRLGAAILS